MNELARAISDALLRYGPEELATGDLPADIARWLSAAGWVQAAAVSPQPEYERLDFALRTIATGRVEHNRNPSFCPICIAREALEVRSEDVQP